MCVALVYQKLTRRWENTQNPYCLLPSSCADMWGMPVGNGQFVLDSSSSNQLLATASAVAAVGLFAINIL